jgi:hypothetical protein
MKTSLHAKNIIKHTRDGHRFDSPYWQSYKNTLPPLPQDVFEVVFGMVLGDAGMRKKHQEAYMRFEQGVKQRDFLFHLFHILRPYCFAEQPGTSRDKTDPLKIKSYWFYTFSHPVFTELFTLFYRPRCDNPKKYIKVLSEGLIRDFLTPRALTYWLMCDGYCHANRKALTIYSEGFTQQENEIISRELNEKFQLHTWVTCRRGRYYSIRVPTRDASRVHDLVAPYMLECFSYKIPQPRACRHVRQCGEGCDTCDI